MPKSRQKLSPSSESLHTAQARRYAEEVVAGQVPACKWVVGACRRHLLDLERALLPDYPFRFDERRADRACRFIEALPHVKGKWASTGQRISLALWQKFVVCSLFGWINKRTGTYRFRIAYVCVPRKNGKSILAASIGLYKMAADGEFGAEVYSGATSEKQAWEVFQPAKWMAERTPDLCRAFGITVNAKSLAIESNGSRFQPIIGTPGDGASPSCAIVDEFHEHASSQLYDTMLTGMGARENPLQLVITTAGVDRAGPCYALQLDVQKVLDGTIQNDKLFGIIYTVDDADDWTSPDALRKANPNYDISVGADFLLDEQKDAIQSARKQNTFKTKHLNLWVNADVAWMNMVDWKRCADAHLSLDDFGKEESCMVGVDLASRIDIAAKIYLFRRMIEGKAHFYAFGVYYLNETAIANPHHDHYWGWANEGLLVRTPGNVTDYNWIAEGIIEDGGKYFVREVPHDPYHAAALIQFIQAHPQWNQGVTFVEVRQTVQQMSPAMKELEALVLDGRFHHNGDPVLGWMISNVVCHRDLKDNIFPRKEQEANKIDGVIALLMALKRWMDSPPDFDGDIQIW